ncbi:MAG TPA: hypothetical protein VIB48_15415 [Acidimicrobiia bacterium]|jgi:hypothetical protein
MAGAVDVIAEAWRRFFDASYVTEYQVRRWAAEAVRALHDEGWTIVREDEASDEVARVPGR